MHPKISIITAVYNRAETISRSINSIKQQSYKNVEIVIIDGKSTDGSLELAKSLLTQNDVIISEPDNGIYDALNKGINHSSGDIIGFLHSDDFFINNNILEKVANIFEINKVDVVYGDAAFFQGNDIESISRVYKSDNLSLSNLSWGKMPAHPAIYISKDIYNKIGSFKVDYSIAADYEFLCRMMSNEDIRSIYIQEIFVKMQLGGISTHGLRSMYLLNKEVLRACRENDIDTNIFMLISKYPSKLFQIIRKRKFIIMFLGRYIIRFKNWIKR